jgi:hypothetical protein
MENIVSNGKKGRRRISSAKNSGESQATRRAEFEYFAPFFYSFLLRNGLEQRIIIGSEPPRPRRDILPRGTKSERHFQRMRERRNGFKVIHWEWQDQTAETRESLLDRLSD